MARGGTWLGRCVCEFLCFDYCEYKHVAEQAQMEQFSFHAALGAHLGRFFVDVTQCCVLPDRTVLEVLGCLHGSECVLVIAVSRTFRILIQVMCQGKEVVM